ncbi:MAG: helix-turn-helix domain-containing protein [Candidatus Tectimicrobiota bacterium]
MSMPQIARKAMRRLVLSDEERQRLAEFVTRPTQATLVPRAQALLWLNAGESVPEVATRLRVSGSTIYAWVRKVQRSPSHDIVTRLMATAHRGWMRPLVTLSDEERQQLEVLLGHPPEATILRRVQAVLWLEAGERISKVASRLGVSRAAIYDWVRRFRSSPTLNVRTRLTDKAQSRRLRPYIILGEQDRQQLETLLLHASEATILRRTQAMLWLHAGEEIAEVASRIGVNSGTIYVWIHRFQRSSPADFLLWLTARSPHRRPRPLIVLSDQERQQLEAIVAQHTEATVLRRAQALLWLHAGEEVARVASRLQVSRSTVYNWLQGFQDTPDSEMIVRLSAYPAPDQAQAIYGVIAPLLRAVMQRHPCELGYDANAWTVTLFCHYLLQTHGITLSEQRLTHVLRRLGQQSSPTQDCRGPAG